MDRRFLILLISVLAAGGLTVLVAYWLAGDTQLLALALPVTVACALILHLLARRQG